MAVAPDAPSSLRNQSEAYQQFCGFLQLLGGPQQKRLAHSQARKRPVEPCDLVDFRTVLV